MASVLMVIAPINFRDEEYLEPLAILVNQGHLVTTASVEVGECRGSQGAIVISELALRDANMQDFDALIFVGGNGSVEYKDNQDAKRLIEQCLDSSKLLAAICAAPSVLAHFGALNGVEATAFPCFEEELVDAGALWTGASVQSGQHPAGSFIVTGNGPAAAHKFGVTLVDSLR